MNWRNLDKNRARHRSLHHRRTTKLCIQPSKSHSSGALFQLLPFGSSLDDTRIEINVSRPNPARNSSNVLAPLFSEPRILGTPLCSSRGWKPLLLRPLPADFLRLERNRSNRVSCESDQSAIFFPRKEGTSPSELLTTPACAHEFFFFFFL